MILHLITDRCALLFIQSVEKYTCIYMCVVGESRSETCMDLQKQPDSLTF